MDTKLACVYKAITKLNVVKTIDYETGFEIEYFYNNDFHQMITNSQYWFIQCQGLRDNILLFQWKHKEFKENPSEKNEIEYVLQFWKLDEQKKTVTIISDHNLGDYMSRIYPSTTEFTSHMTEIYWINSIMVISVEGVNITILSMNNENDGNNIRFEKLLEVEHSNFIFEK